MVRAELMGGHTHSTLCGTEVHVWKRDGKYLVRGRYQGQPFGETLGANVLEATTRLRQLLTEIDDGCYVRPSEARKRLLGNGRPGRRTLRQLISDFLDEKRQTRGKQTASDYKARLMPVLTFAEQSENRKHWPFMQDIDQVIVTLRCSFSIARRNGRSGGTPKLLSSRQVYNVLQCLRTLLAWASSPEIRKLPADWANPLTQDLIGDAPLKDPLREDKLPLELRTRVVSIMDRWQLCHLVFSLVLPLRPDEAAGLLVSDVNFNNGWLEFGHTFTDCNFTKAATVFRLPFPEELVSILQACIGGRPEGPLLRRRSAFADGNDSGVKSQDDLERRYEDVLCRQPRDTVNAP